MDIHPPEHPIRSLRDFAVQIFTVTCGILIALGLEALSERHHNHMLAQHARAAFFSEISHNKAKLETVLTDADNLDGELTSLLSYGEARLHHTPPKLPHMSTRAFAIFSSTAWETALATQAVGQLGFAEADAVAAAYTKQAALNELTGRARDQWLQIAAYDNLDELSEADIRAALKQVRIAFTYAATIRDLETQLRADYVAAEKALVGQPR